MKKTLNLIIILLLSSFLLSGCGGGGSGSNNSMTTSSSEDIADIAIDHIVQYAQNNSHAPSIQDYIDAEVTGVTEDNLEEVNAVIAGLTKEDVDTKEEIQAIVDSLLVNLVPTADAGSDKSVQTNQSITITGSGSDSDGSITSYQWKEGSTILSNAASFTYTAPSSAGTHTLTLTVTDDDGATGSDTMVVTVTNPPAANQAPTADAGSDKSVQTNQSITITGSGSDSDGSITSYQWKEGSTILSNAASFTYTAPSSAGTHTLTLTVTDDDGATGSDTMVVTVTSDSTIHITEDYQVERLGTASSINISVSIDTSTSKDLYILLTNYDESTSASIAIDHSNKIIAEKVEKTTITTNENITKPTILRAPQNIQEFNNQLIPSALVSKSEKTILIKNSSVEGDTQTFYLDTTSSGDSTQATLKKVVSGINTEFGNKTLNVWVSDDSFDSGSGCSKSKCVTQAMVDALADTFLMSGSDNDIYDWVTNIFGEEWGSDAKNTYSNLIDETNEIDILLTDIDNDDSANGGVIGYFYSKDNYESSSVSGSNEKIMFYVDAVMFANGDVTWDIDDFWPKEIISTLAHEFQHMIHFYQKTIPTNGATDTWINEMLSETIEEVISTKIHNDGPRGVDYTDGSAGSADNTHGRYPGFNENNTLSLTNWNGSLADYSKVNAFGAFLVRNYGGVEVLHDIVDNNYTQEDAIVYAIHNAPNGSEKTFDDLLREWGIAVILSDHTNLQNTPEYNTGDFTSDTYNSSTYQLGSINFFNYSPQPTIYTSNGTVEPQGNYYYKVGENLTGTITIDISLNGTTEATLIAK